MTRADTIVAFEVICRDILHITGTPAMLALERAGIGNIIDFLSTQLSQIDNFSYRDEPTEAQPNPPLKNLSIGHCNRLKWFIRWAETLWIENDKVPLSLQQWRDAPLEGYNDYRISNGGSYVTTPPPPAAVPQQATRRIDVLSEFKKGIKRDPQAYPVLKEQKFWNNWNRSVIAQARAHDISEVFDLNYRYPLNDPDAMLLFDQKQSFAYSVLNKCVLTDQGKSFVREHEGDYDAQAVYRKLVAYAQTSTAAELAKDQLIEYVTTTKLDSRWRGSTEGFLLHWREQFRLLEEMLPTSQLYDPFVKKRMLEASVRPIPELQMIKEIDSNRIAAGGNALNYDQYSTLLMSAAVQRDDKLKLPSSRNNRIVQNAETVPFSNREEDWYHHGYVDAGDGYYLAQATDQQLAVHRMQQRAPTRNNEGTRERTPFLPREIWEKLSEDARLIIRGLDPSQTNRSVNLHDIGTAYPYHHEEEGSQVGVFETAETGERANATEAPQEIVGDEVSNLLAHVTKRKTTLPSHDIRSVLATTHTPRPATSKPAFQTASSSKETITVNGKRYVQADMHHVSYRVANNVTTNSPKVASLVDRGANGGLAGSDVRLIETTSRFADVSGIDNHTLGSLPIATVAGVAQTHFGPVCLILHQYAYHGKGKTIHSSVQIEHFGNDVNDKSIRVNGGKQRITTVDGYAIPVQIRGGLAYIDMHPPDDEEWETLPHVVLTSDADWDPTVVDNDLPLEEWLDALMDAEELPGPNDYEDLRFDCRGEYRRIVEIQQTIRSYRPHFFDAEEGVTEIIEQREIMSNKTSLGIFPHDVKARPPDFLSLRPMFAWATEEVIKRTFDVTTQWARSTEHYPFRKHFKSRFPALNVHRRREAVATDTVYSDTPAVDDGATSAQIFVGIDTLVTDIYGMKTDKEFVYTLEDNIRKRGAMDKLVSDRAQLEISNRVKDILRNLIIDDWQSEPYHEHQNAAERRYQVVKTTTNKVLDRTGASANSWLLALIYVCYVLNHLATESLSWQTPLFRLTGDTSDISALLQFSFWEPVYYATADAVSYNSKPSFPSESAEEKGRFVGFGDSVGDVLTYKVLTDDTQKVIYRSYVRSALNDEERNKRLENDDPSLIVEVVKSPERPLRQDGSTAMMVIDPDDLINRTYLTQADDQGQRFRAKIVQKIIERENEVSEHPDRVKFLVRVGGDKVDEIVDYNDIIQYLEDEMSTENQDVLWTFKDIIAHEGPLKPGDHSYKGSNYNVMIVWEDGSKSFEPLNIIGADCPVLCAMYGKKMGLLDTPGWKRFKSLAKREKKMLRMLHQAKISSFRNAPIYQFGFKVPRFPNEAIKYDLENKNNLWQDAMALEMQQLQEYETFKDLGKDAPGPPDHKKIRVHFVFAVKHDGRHKARLVADGHLTETPIDSVYSGVVTLRSLRIVIFLSELNDMQLHAADVSNAYLEAVTKEKIYIIGGIGFGDLDGHTLLIHKALYGLKSSGKRWHERLSDALRAMDFFPSKADSDVWLRKVDGLYEYIASYVDDLAIVSKEPSKIIESLEKQGFKLKGVGPMSYHLGCDYTRDPDGTLSYGPRRYIEKILDSYEQMYGEQPRHYASPLEKNDHPELDDSLELDADGIKRYQSMIGALQWSVSLGRFDIHTAVMTMGSFRIAPRAGHLDRLKRIYGYLRRFKHAAIRVRTGYPDYSSLKLEDHDWLHSVYGNVVELVPEDAPEPLGKHVVTTTYEDANLFHDVVTGRAVTGVLHLLNGTPVDWYSKRQDTVETATYGSEFVAARIATEQIIDMRTTLRYLGVPIMGRAYMFGDNQSVITSSTIPHSQLNKRHNALSYHRVREAIVAKIMHFCYVSGKENPADILSKHCGYPQLWPHVQPLLFWMGSTLGCNNEVAPLDGQEERVEI
jgi:hypothetical protein